MMFANLRRWTARALTTLTLLAALSESPSLLWSQVAAAASPTIRKEFSKDAKFKLPIRIDPAAGEKVREVILYVKQSPTTPWLRHESVPPSVSHFTYESQNDGEYFFQLVTVDQSGKPSPADINKVGPGLHVIVDTKTPSLEGQYGHVDGEPCVRCVMSDENADQQSVKAYAVSPMGERLLEPKQRQANVFRLGSNDVHSNIRIEGTDLAGNKATKLLPSLKSLQGGSPVASAPTPPSTPTPPIATAPPPPASQGLSVSAVNPPAPLPLAKDADPTPPITPTPPPAFAQNNPPAMTPPSVPPQAPVAPPTLPAAPLIVEAAPPAAPLPPVAQKIPTAPLPLVDHNTTQVSTFPSEAISTNAGYRVDPQPQTARTLGNRKLLGTRRASIDYRLDAVGSSGVGKVEIYMTPDGGQTWIPLGEDRDKTSPADVDLPGEGVYGVRLVITNNHGFGGKAPVRGDQPHVVIEIDATAPAVQVRPIEIVPQQASIDIRWNAQDNRQLADEPISIYYRARSDSSWLPIARNIKNEGQHRWALPRDVPGQFTLKVEAVDLAGNVGRAESSPITLDVQVPSVEVLGVAGGRN